MSTIVRAIQRTYAWADDNDSPIVYWAIDVHGTVLRPDYQDQGIAKEFYPFAKEVLQLLSKHPDNKLIMFTSSRPNMIDKYNLFFLENGIVFSWFNENPQVKTKQYGHRYFEDKFYFNVMLEDKAGFEPETDWLAILQYLKKRL